MIKRQKWKLQFQCQNLVLRAEEVHDDMYAAIDLITDKLERQIRKHKTKVNRKVREKGGINELFVNNGVDLENDLVVEDDNELEVVRQKSFDLKPMDSEEAILQMNMLGHSFYVFTNGDTDRTNVVYKRKVWTLRSYRNTIKYLLFKSAQNLLNGTAFYNEMIADTPSKLINTAASKKLTPDLWKCYDIKENVIKLVRIQRFRNESFSYSRKTTRLK